ncbi:MAG: hypothetical protein HZA61_16325 [Candidatus Eisenbacteria bacterium]|uniref:Uncharacterized protein n=1 Tax=Eiseniibacteriota bacterium TaxID=2212470 RepID=A0A933SIR6_UNCEI|nr:hypothetical protein [Candidatus Eisenbacteria bacterium]
MNPIRMAAVGTVTLALILYSIGTLRTHQSRKATGAARGFLSAGLFFDILATGLMIVASGSLEATLHGWLGYSALTFMLVDVALLWRHWKVSGMAELPSGLHLYSRLAYAYWVVAYFTGAALVMAAKRAGQ